MVTFNQVTQILSYAANGAALDALKAGATATDTFTYTIADAAGAASTATVTATVTGVNDAPVLNQQTADQTAAAGSAFTLQLAANVFADIDSGDTLAYSAQLASGVQLPSWLAFDAATRRFSGTPANTDAGNYSIKVTATDSGSLSAFESFTLAVSGGASGQTLLGTPKNDVLNGGAGNDILNGQAGADRLLGNAGNDTLQYFADNKWPGGFVAVNGGSPGNAGTGLTAAINGRNRSFDVFDGGAGQDVLVGTDGDDAIFLDDAYSAFPAGRVPRIAGIERIEGGAGNDVIDLTSPDFAYGDVALDGGVGNDVLWASGGNDALYGQAGNDELSGGAGRDFLAGGAGNDTLNGDGGNDLLEGDDGNDSLQDTAGRNLFHGGAGSDAMTGGSGNELFAGGAGNDSIATGAGADIVAFNRGDGHDTIAASTEQDNTLSLGGGIRYAELYLSKQGNNLVLQTAVNDDVTLKDWYGAAGKHSVLNMQVIAEAMAGFNPGSGDPLYGNKIELFDFNRIVQKFDQARAANQGVNQWAVMNALLDAHLSGSDSEAIGGDLAYRYGLSGSLAGIATGAAENVIANVQFGIAPQVLQPLAGLQDGLVKLG